MVCEQCGKEISESSSITYNGLRFCNNLCRFSHEKAKGNTGSAFSRNDGARPLPPASRQNTAARGKMPAGALALSFLYFVIIYFVGCVLVGGIFGGIAGMSDPAHASEAGGRAGSIMVQKYRFFIMLIAFIVTQAGTLGQWLPFMKKASL